MINLKEIRVRAEASTSGLEVRCDHNEQINLYGEESFWLGLLPHQCVRSIEEQQKKNAEFFISARGDVLALVALVEARDKTIEDRHAPIDMMLFCPACGLQHVDAPELGGWTNPPHKSHLCHECGHVWRPADLPTNGVRKTRTAGATDSVVALDRAGFRAVIVEREACAKIADDVATNPGPLACQAIAIRIRARAR